MRVLYLFIGVYSTVVILMSAYIVYVGIVEPTNVTMIATGANCFTLLFLCLIFRGMRSIRRYRKSMGLWC